MSSPKVFQRENIYCFELEVTAAKDVGRFKLLCNTEDFEKKNYYFSILYCKVLQVLKVNTSFLNFLWKEMNLSNDEIQKWTQTTKEEHFK